MADLLPGFWCPTCAVGWFERAQPKCSAPLTHYTHWVESPRPADDPAHSVTHDDRALGASS